MTFSATVSAVNDVENVPIFVLLVAASMFLDGFCSAGTNFGNGDAFLVDDDGVLSTGDGGTLRVEDGDESPKVAASGSSVVEEVGDAQLIGDIGSLPASVIS